MVKFAKQLDSQLVQEWREKYLNYKQLKRDIKKVTEQLKVSPPVVGKWSNVPITPITPSGPILHSGPLQDRQLSRRLSHSVKSFVSATGHAANALASKPSKKYRPRDFIQVKRKEGDPDVYSTDIADFVHGVESSKIFFSRLDQEFNKVNQFYRKKEQEFSDHHDNLQKQVKALADIRITLAQGSLSSQNSQDDHSTSMEKSNRPQTINEAVDQALHKRRAQFSDSKSIPPLDIAKKPPLGASPVIMEDDSDNYFRVRDAHTSKAAQPGAGSSEPEPITAIEMEVVMPKNGNDGSSRSGSSDGGDSSKPQMRLNIPLHTPGTTIKSLTQSLWEEMQKQGVTSKHGPVSKDEVQFSVTKKNVNIAERMLRTAFVEFYRGLTLLKAYSSLNMVAFAKILKKYDKASGNKCLPIYLKAVEGSYFNTSEKVVKMIEDVEVLFATYFAGGDNSKARVYLRPPEKKSSHKVTFFLGLFTGGSLALIAVFATLLDRMLDSYILPESEQAASPSVGAPAAMTQSIYLKTIFPTFAASALIIIHMFMYGLNIFYWRKWRINYAFMFDFKQGTELRHREVLMAASILMTILLAAMVGQLALHSVSDSPYVDLIPLGVFALLVVLLFFPLNLFYRSSRIFLLTAFFHLIMSPLYKVVLQDFFLGDQLTSQVPMLRDVQYLMCYYTGGFFKHSNADGCLNNSVYKGFTYAFSLMPYVWRFLQCMRRYVEEKDIHQAQNAGKYMSAMVAVVLRIEYNKSQHNHILFVLHLIASLLATAYQIFWDLVRDWGLLRSKSKNKWLRDNLIMPKAKYIYYWAIVANLVLRFAWLQSIYQFRFGQMDFQVADFTFAALEVIRRGIWNFFRMENEHLNNVGKYRATKTVPLPFENPTSEDY